MRRKKFLIPIEIVPHHVHLSQKMWQALFGKNFQPQILRPLSQRGQVVYQQTIKILGPKGEMENVRVLGGARKQTQVEFSEVEAVALGIKPVYRMSGKLLRTSGCKLVGPAGKAIIKSGVIVPIPHLHLNTKEAATLDLHQNQEIELGFFEDKTAKLKVLVRVHPSFRATLHITPDVAAKLWLSNSDKAIL